MAITLERLQQSAASLGNLAQVGSLPVKKKYWLSRLIDKVDAELKAFEKARIELVKKHGEGDEQQGWRVLPENLVAFGKDQAELLTVEIDLGIDLSFSIEELDSDRLTAADFLNLRWLIAEPE